MPQLDQHLGFGLVAKAILAALTLAAGLWMHNTQLPASPMMSMHTRQQLRSTVEMLLGEGKGILAADESEATIGKRVCAKGKSIHQEKSSRAGGRNIIFQAKGDRSVASWAHRTSRSARTERVNI